MQNGIHFISGLPRAGSTLLAGILRQNPRFHAGMTSGVGSLMLALLGEMSQRNEFGVFFNNEQRKEILRGVILGYYKDVHAKKMVFDTNRFWCSRMSLVAGYTWSHALDQASLNRAQQPQDSTHPGAEYGSSDLDIRHRLTLSMTYDIPGRDGFAQMLKG